MHEIREVRARQVLDSRGNPTVEAEVFTKNNSARAIVPSGASTGIHEALELRDGGREYLGKGVKKAVNNILWMRKFLIGRSVIQQEEIDTLMRQFDGTKNKRKYGANAILAVSLACARVAAKEEKKPLFEYLSNLFGEKPKMPTPFMNIINGGMHADNDLDFQEYMLVPKGDNFSDSLRIGVEVYHELKKVLKKRGLSTGVGDEGGFAPDLKDYEEPIKLILQAAKNLGYEKKVKIALDIAASDIYFNGKYIVEGKKLSANQLSDLYGKLIKKYPIVSIEDPFHEEDFKAFADFTKKYGKKIKVVGDDLLVTNVSRMHKALDIGACNTLLLKVNQIGTLTEAMKAANLAYRHGWGVMVSHRSGETEDSFIADLAVALGCGMIKTGAPCRGERTAKYNQLLRIEEKIY
ncbi:MAG: phosphopyruvate hydratase [archaeon]